jgi:hypothetical protein
MADVGVLTAIAVLVVAPAVGTAPVAPPPEPRTIEARVDRLFARGQRPDSPGCSVGISRGVTTVLERVAAYPPSVAALAALAGDYRSDELSTTYTLRVRNDALTIDVPGHASLALLPIRSDVFAGSLVGSLRFARGRAGTPTGFTVHAYAARGVRFERSRPDAAR